MNNDLLRLFNLVSSMLETNCPVLSGNMKSGIEVTEIKDNEVTFCINAPFYDTDIWKQTGAIVYILNLLNPEQTSYANDVNLYGGFKSYNKSRFWVNRSLVQAGETIANEIGAKLVNMLPT